MPIVDTPVSRRRLLRRGAAVTAALAVVAAAPAVTSAVAADPVLLHQGVVTRQDIASQPGSEADTVVEPDVQASPVDTSDVIAAAHDSRFPDGGAVSISVSWSHDAGTTWHHQPVPGLTTATGGTWDRASDPVVAWGPDGTAYLSVLVFMTSTCPSAVVVLRSTDAGQTWSAPVAAHRSNTCAVSDDKNWIVVDNSPQSPHLGRVYQFWTPFFYPGGQYRGAAQAVRWSDDRGRTWSATSYLTPTNHGTQDSQPMILANGDVVDTFYDYGQGHRVPDVGPYGVDNPRNLAIATRGIDPTGTVYASRSSDGGQSWTTPTEVINNAGGYASGVRCCLMSATVDPSTQIMYVAYEGYGQHNTDPVLLVSSRDGALWTSPVPVSHGDVAGVQRVNVDVSALRGRVYVAFGTRTDAGDDGGFVQQQLATSTDRGVSFGAPLSLGPVSQLRYAAQAGGYFPGDYIGTSVVGSRLYLVWAVSSTPPPASSSPYHQVIYGATLRVP